MATTSQPDLSEAAPIEGADADASVRRAILDSTYGLLIDHGYADVTTDDIAAAARVSKATIYRHWETKQALVVAAARMHFGEVEPPDLDSFPDEIRWILEHRAKDYRETGTLRLVGGLLGAATTDPQLQTLFTDWVEQLTRAVRHAIQRGIARGDVRPEVDGYALETLVAGVVARTVVAQHSISSATVEAVVELVTRAVAPQGAG
ncbi:TetR/AcrR family transcriptional regulator [Actinomycetota bacterium]